MASNLRVEEDDHLISRRGTAAESWKSSRSSSSNSPSHSDLHQSMTAKGIQRLCSELVEINEASEEDFRRNVYLSLLEAGDLEKEVRHLKQQAMAQSRLIQDVRNSLYYPYVMALHQLGSESEDDGEGDVVANENAAAALALDALVWEHQHWIMEQQATMPQGSGVLVSSAWRARVADRLASVAEHPRTPRPELLRALAGLCRLGEARRANHLLVGFYRACALRRVDELRQRQRQKKAPPSWNYVKELVRTVLSTVVEARRSVALLRAHGGLRPSSELGRWAREQMEGLAVAFRELVVAAADDGDVLLAQALEAARCALSCCPDDQYLRELLVPCMEAAMAIYAGHLREVVRLLAAASDDGAWALGRFLVSGVLRRRTTSSSSRWRAQEEELRCCLLPSSGRKLATLLQEVVEDVSPVLDMGLTTTSALEQLLAELFREYMAAIPPAADHISVLINCTTLLSVFPLIPRGIFFIGSSQDSDSDFDFDSSIKEAAGHVWTSFCQHFIRDTMASLHAQPCSSGFAGTMPSSAFRLNSLHGGILTGEDGTAKKLLHELMEAMILWLSDNLDIWTGHVPKDTLVQQIQLDVHFLLEVAQLGGFSSNNLRNSAMGLLRKALPSSVEHPCTGEEWDAADAAKLAVRVLMGMGCQSQPNSTGSSSLQQQEDDAHEGVREEADGAMQPDSWQSKRQIETGACCDGKLSSDEFVSIEDKEALDSD